MKNIKLRKEIILFIFIIINPLVLIANKENLIRSINNLSPSQGDIHLRVGALGIARDWDPAIYSFYYPYTRGSNVISDYYVPNCLERLYWQPDASTEVKPCLATSWEYEFWPEEYNPLGFKNRGGVKAIDITLRSGVTFHDGSDWNANVAKWNLDRLIIISGNLSGRGDLRNKRYFWDKVEDNERYFTASWNHSHRKYKPGWYYDGTTNWTNPRESEIISWYPIWESVESLEDFQSGGKIRVEFNVWNSFGIRTLDFPMISMNTYSDYYDTGIYGWDGSGFMLIGTGPYKYGGHSELTSPAGGTLVKNLNYWNRTNLETNGRFDADFIDIYSYPLDSAGEFARNNAMLDHIIDYGVDSPQEPFDYGSIILIPNITYFERGYTDAITSITLNSINETWMSWTSTDPRNPTGFNYVDVIESIWNGDRPDGIPRSLRKAISYAFDYETYINIILNGRAIRAGGVLGVDNIYYNGSIPKVYYNLTYARRILLNAEPDQHTWRQIANFSAKCYARGLDKNSSDSDWQWVADHDPLWELNFYWDDHFTPLKNLLQANLRDIGIALKDPTGATNFIPTNMWDKVSTYYIGTFPAFSAHAWPLDWVMPNIIPERWVEMMYFDPNRGTWRSDPRSPVDDPNFDWFPWFNLHFCYDSDIDYWLEHLWFSNQTGKLRYLNNIVKKAQSELYPMIYIAQNKKGAALWNDWVVNFNRGDLFFANFHYTVPTSLSPGNINLYSDAGTPDIDGNFNLIWNVSLRADNYSIYRYGSKITQLNGSIDLIIDQVAVSPFSVNRLIDGEYYYVIVAYNSYGYTLSNNVHIIVQLPKKPPDEPILGYSIILMLILTIGMSAILIKKKKSKTN
ncbi:MAG: ABC transporter substrate-binding protein [Promethearchaeota archaeon]